MACSCVALLISSFLKNVFASEQGLNAKLSATHSLYHLCVPLSLLARSMQSLFRNNSNRWVNRYLVLHDNTLHYYAKKGSLAMVPHCPSVHMHSQMHTHAHALTYSHLFAHHQSHPEPHFACCFELAWTRVCVENASVCAERNMNKKHNGSRRLYRVPTLSSAVPTHAQHWLATLHRALDVVSYRNTLFCYAGVPAVGRATTLHHAHAAASVVVPVLARPRSRSADYCAEHA
jgi:hypothetical protein